MNYKSSLLSPEPTRKKIMNAVLYRKKYLAAVGLQIWFVELTSYDENSNEETRIVIGLTVKTMVAAQ